MTGTLQIPDPTWFVGCGNMGGAILDGWRTGGLDLSPLIVFVVIYFIQQVIARYIYPNVF